MARYTGAKVRITRRLGDLPGFTSKKSKLKQRPGQHGATKKKLTQYALRLEEKQKHILKATLLTKTINGRMLK